MRFKTFLEQDQKVPANWGPLDLAKVLGVLLSTKFKDEDFDFDLSTDGYTLAGSSKTNRYNELIAALVDFTSGGASKFPKNIDGEMRTVYHIGLNRPIRGEDAEEFKSALEII